MLAPIANNFVISSPPIGVRSASDVSGDAVSRLPSDSVSTPVSSTQLDNNASSDIPSEIRGIFVQYDKLASYAAVKYKPSNAGKPIAPESVFSTLPQQEMLAKAQIGAYKAAIKLTKDIIL